MPRRLREGHLPSGLDAGKTARIASPLRDREVGHVLEDGMRMVTGKSRAGMVSVAVVLLALVAFPGAARAAVGDLFVDSCVNGGPAKPNCAVSPGLSGAWPEVLSPDGRQLYVAVAGNGGSEVPAVLTFDRNPGTGQLTRRP